MAINKIQTKLQNLINNIADRISSFPLKERIKIDASINNLELKYRFRHLMIKNYKSL